MPARVDRPRRNALRRAPTSRAPALVARRGGFTLFELLVALAITGIIISATYAAVSTALDAADRNRAAERETHRERNARMVLTSLLRAARIDLGADPEGFRALQPSDTPSGHEELRFLSALGFPFAGFPAQDLIRARLWLAPGEAQTSALLLTIESVHPGANHQETLALFDDLAGVEIAYRAHLQSTWSDQWDSRVAVPASIRIQLHGPRPRPDIVVLLPLAQQR